MTGSILLYEPKTGLYRTSDLRRAQTRYRQASTFKIFNALAAIEAGVVHGPDEPLHWDGVDRCVAGWNRDLSLRTAYQESAFWVYQRFARQLAPIVCADGYDKRTTGIRISAVGSTGIGWMASYAPPWWIKWPFFPGCMGDDSPVRSPPSTRFS